MRDVIAVLRRLGGLYTPYLEPYWDEQDAAMAAAWNTSNDLEGASEALESRLRERFPESADVVLTDSGKSALFAALKMLAVEPASEVILPSYCCASVIASVIRADCVPVLADSDEHFNISLESATAALSSRTQAIVVPHLWGLKAAALEGLVALGRQRGIAVIEDVTQAYGLRLLDGRRAGSLGDAAIFSAGLGKPTMGPGGGWLIMNRSGRERPSLGIEPHEEYTARFGGFLRRFWGARARRGFSEIEFAVRLRVSALANGQSKFDIRKWADSECRVRHIAPADAWFAARQIERIEGNLERRRVNARHWHRLLAAANIPCVTLPGETNVHTVFPVTFLGKEGVRQAARFRRSLERAGVATEPCYTPLHLKPYGKAFRRADTGCIDALWQKVFALPVRPNLLPADWGRIERAIRRAAPHVRE